MDNLPRALALDQEELKMKIESIQAFLEDLPDTFYALFWLYTHDFLYVSRSIQDVLGHTYEKYENHGMVFFQSIIPPHLINHIYEAMNAQAAEIEKHPDYIFANQFLNVDAAVLNSETEEVPVTYNAVFLDVKAFKPTSFLVLCSWIDIRDKNKEQILRLSDQIKDELIEVKQHYIKSKPEHFKSLLCRKKITSREKEVASLLMKGHSTKGISEQLGITFNTVESHRRSLLEKLESKNTAELVTKLASIPL
ncbi:helix-turn-helix transcriptional regulator [Salinimicrobium sp. TH3]|uniref:helix-turn-helix transcriptional regulator n=1 Tax=Salinimicrobium sp. TH3 TaxID=2997342 RepID=UPI00227678B9|nr:helix-turn-helix transcriptional regulator [Salinimicrobium sp. TH3]MCY2687596.1 helix-turn-helix transcriptional regulator [Salinimicrobium sp. TH3]